MSRIPYLKHDELDEQGRALWDVITSTRGDGVITAEGGLAGPFNPWLHAPEAGTRLADLGATLRFKTSVDRRLLELAIITVGAHWQAEFEWWAHSRMARQHGVADEIVDAIGRGDPPPLTADDERAVYNAARQLVTTGRLDDAAYSAAAGVLGEQGIVEIVSLVGYYTLVSFTLNAFEVPLPPGVEPAFSAGR